MKGRPDFAYVSARKAVGCPPPRGIDARLVDRSIPPRSRAAPRRLSTPGLSPTRITTLWTASSPPRSTGATESRLAKEPPPVVEPAGAVTRAAAEALGLLCRTLEVHRALLSSSGFDVSAASLEHARATAETAFESLRVARTVQATLAGVAWRDEAASPDLWSGKPAGSIGTPVTTRGARHNPSTAPVSRRQHASLARAERPKSVRGDSDLTNAMPSANSPLSANQTEAAGDTVVDDSRATTDKDSEVPADPVPVPRGGFRAARPRPRASAVDTMEVGCLDDDDTATKTNNTTKTSEPVAHSSDRIDLFSEQFDQAGATLHRLQLELGQESMVRCRDDTEPAGKPRVVEEETANEMDASVQAVECAPLPSWGHDDLAPERHPVDGRICSVDPAECGVVATPESSVGEPGAAAVHASGANVANGVAAAAISPRLLRVQLYTNYASASPSPHHDRRAQLRRALEGITKALTVAHKDSGPCLPSPPGRDFAVEEPLESEPVATRAVDAPRAIDEFQTACPRFIVHPPKQVPSASRPRPFDTVDGQITAQGQAAVDLLSLSSAELLYYGKCESLGNKNIPVPANHNGVQPSVELHPTKPETAVAAASQRKFPILEEAISFRARARAVPASHITEKFPTPASPFTDMLSRVQNIRESLARVGSPQVVPEQGQLPRGVHGGRGPNLQSKPPSLDTGDEMPQPDSDVRRPRVLGTTNANAIKAQIWDSISPEKHFLRDDRKVREIRGILASLGQPCTPTENVPTPPTLQTSTPEKRTAQKQTRF